MLSIAAASTTAFTTPFVMRAPLSTIKMEAVAAVEEEAPPPKPFNGVEFAKTLPGITGPLDFFDPAGFCSQEGITEGKVRFFRDHDGRLPECFSSELSRWHESIQLKTCRIDVLASDELFFG